MAEINSFQIGSVTYDMRDERTKQNLASVFSTGVEYKAGDYAEYDTQLYQFIVDHPAGAWDASQVVAVNLAAGVSEALKSRENFSTKAPVIINSASGDIASFADGADDMPIKKIVGTIVPVQGGTGNPSPDNVRPISGWPGTNIVCSGENLWDDSFYGSGESWGLNLITDSTDPFYGYYGNNIKAWSNHYTGVGYEKYHFGRMVVSADLGNASYENSYTFKIYFSYTDGTSSDSGNITVAASSSRTVHILSAAGKTVRYLLISTNAGTGNTNGRIKNVDIRIYDGDSEPAYIEPTRNTLPINWETEAGTIYDGTVTLNEDGSVDVVSEWAMKEFDGSDDEGWTGSPNNRQYISVTPKPYYRYYEDSHILCDKLVNRSSQGSTGAWYACFIYGEYTIGVHINSETSAATIKTWLAENPITVIYRMDVPQTYHFDNIGELYTYFGTNNVWIDTGSITECDYPADTKLFLTARDAEITENIAPIENGATASQAYAQGAYFWHDAKFCKALTAIASGATFTLNTNYVETTVAVELLAAQN